MQLTLLASQPASQPASHPAHRPVSRSANQTASQPDNCFFASCWTIWKFFLPFFIVNTMFFCLFCFFCLFGGSSPARSARESSWPARLPDGQSASQPASLTSVLFASCWTIWKFFLPFFIVNTMFFCLFCFFCLFGWTSPARSAREPSQSVQSENVVTLSMIASEFHVIGFEYYRTFSQCEIHGNFRISEE